MKTLTVRGKRFKVKNVSAPKGRCQIPTAKGKEIHIPVDGDSLGELVVIIHELLHAAFWDLDEASVNQVGHDIGRVLWALNWRKEIDEK